MARHNRISRHSKQWGNKIKSYSKDHANTDATSPRTVFVLIGICALLVYFYMKRKKTLAELRERQHQEYLRWMKTDPEETLRRRINNARKAKLVETLQEEHAKLSAETAEGRRKKYIEDLNKKLAVIEHLNSMTNNSTSVIKSQVHKTKYSGVLPTESHVEPVASSSRSIPSCRFNTNTQTPGQGF